ncbi:MAG: glycosyltransferase family 2 protein [Gemmatimonadales bacterium]|nr:MAG: glycosyltransferase family 2 protein [Gemmatimonadales bacterium]
MPFLTVLTRTCKRPKMLERNKESLRAQTDQDYEHIILEDDQHRGMLFANSQFYENRHLVNGEYVYLLDDDDYLINPEFVRTLKDVARDREAPDVIVFQFDHLHLGLQPGNQYAGEPHAGAIGGSSFVVRSGPWLKHIKEFCRKEGGDFVFIRKLWDRGYRFANVAGVMGRIGQVGRGKQTEE